MDGRSYWTFEKTKQDLINATLLAHSAPNSKLRLIKDASGMAMGAVLEQSTNNNGTLWDSFQEVFAGAN